MKKPSLKTRLKEIEDEMIVNSRKTDLSRARSFAVGTAFGGTTEIYMRGDGGQYLWVVLQPVEVTELIHQLAGNIGCHVALKPRNDFGSWRDWRIPEAEKKHLQGHPPFVNDMSVFKDIGTTKFDQLTAEQSFEDYLKLKSYDDFKSNDRGGSGGDGVWAGMSKEDFELLMKKQQNSINEKNDSKGKTDENAMAAKKAINKRKSKRTSGTP